MADAKKCDRCGKLFEPYLKSDRYKNPNKYICVIAIDKIVSANRYDNQTQMDLCQECAKSLDKWVKLGGDNNEQ